MEGLTLFQAIVAVLMVLLLAYYCSKLLGKQWGKSSGSANIRVVEYLQVGQNQKILLISVQEHFYLIGVSQAGIQLLTEMEGVTVPDETQPARLKAQLPFQELMEKYLESHPKKRGKSDE